MKAIVLILLNICSGILFAQRLYLHDMHNGNFKSYGIGSKIELTILNSTVKVEGRITAMETDGFYVDGTTHVLLKEVVSVIVGRKAGAPRRVLRIIGGSILILYGVPSIISGLVIAAVGEPVVGGFVILLGGGLTAAGIWIIASQRNAVNEVIQRFIDNKTYRLFIERN